MDGPWLSRLVALLVLFKLNDFLTQKYAHIFSTVHFRHSSRYKVMELPGLTFKKSISEIVLMRTLIRDAETDFRHARPANN